MLQKIEEELAFLDKHQADHERLAAEYAESQATPN